jgi:hypothetical protein
MPDYRALAQALDPYAMDTGGITPDTIKALQSGYKSPNLLGMIADIGRGGLSNLESLVRGGVAQVPGTVGDLETLGRMGINTSFGAGGVKVSPKAVMPTTTDILGMLPQRVTQARPETEGMEQLGGAMNPRGPINLGRAVMRLPSDVARAGKEFLMANQPSRLDVYHGTPHSFERFDASKIGTGEGAQAYGYGIYVAENPKVATEYRNTLSGNRNLDKFVTTVDGKPAESPVLKVIINKGGDPKKFIEDMQPKLKSLENKMLSASKEEVLPGVSDYDMAKMDYERHLQMVNEANGYIGKKIKNEPLGNLYKADLPDEMIPKMLNWDKPLSEQTPEVQKILYPYQKEIGSSFGTGEQTLRQIAFERRMKGLDDSPSAVAQQLKDMGITGVRYLDEASRGTNYRGDSAFFHAATDFKVNDYSFDDALDGMKKAYKNATEQELKDALDAVYTPKTSNFVVFPGQEQNLTILERNAEKITK